MVKNHLVFIVLALFSMGSFADVRLKDLARIEGARENSLIGYGVVVGLSGSGDSARNKATLQSLANTLSNFGVKVTEADINSRNSAAVMITATLAPFAEVGGHLDVQVASLGDAKSLAGGTLLLTPLYGPDQRLYALAQGSVSVGGYRVDSFASSVQKNYPNVGIIARGATIEQTVERNVLSGSEISIILNQPDYTTADRIVKTIAAKTGLKNITAVHPGKVSVEVPENVSTMSFIASLESITVNPDVEARVVVNERTGTIVAGSNVQLGAVSIAHGELRIEIDTRFEVSQPTHFFGRNLNGVETVTVPETEIRVSEKGMAPVNMSAGATVGDLVHALNSMKLSTRDVISILQSIKSAGALHAELVIQ